MINQSPLQFGDVFLTFVKHDDGRNRGRVFNRMVWLLILGVPFDFRNSEDIAKAVSKFGCLISWENDQEHMGRVITKVRVTDLDRIPKSIRWSEGEDFEEDAWSSSVEILLHEMLGGGPADEDPIPPDNVDPHPLPNAAQNAHNFHQNAGHNNEEDNDVADMNVEEGHWAWQQPPFHNEEHVDAPPAIEQDELIWEEGEKMLPHVEAQSSITTTVSLSDGAFSNNLLLGNGSEEVNQEQHVQLQAVGLFIGDGLINLLHAYPVEDDPEQPLLAAQEDLIAPQPIDKAPAVNSNIL